VGFFQDRSYDGHRINLNKFIKMKSYHIYSMMKQNEKIIRGYLLKYTNTWKVTKCKSKGLIGQWRNKI
jgi:hypothetical protein